MSKHNNLFDALDDFHPEEDETEENLYPDAVDGDVYLNPMFGDLWLVDRGYFIKINEGYTIELNDPAGFIKVGHIDGVTSKNMAIDG